jgi:hypothetical protein
MNRTSSFALSCTLLGLLLISFSFSGPLRAEKVGNEFVSRVADVQGVKLHYMTGGHGPALVLLHGYAETSRMWPPILPVLGEKVTVIVSDLPGIGDSSIPAVGLGSLLRISARW